MAKLILSAFSDEYADGLKEQCQALNGLKKNTPSRMRRKWKIKTRTDGVIYAK